MQTDADIFDLSNNTEQWSLSVEPELKLSKTSRLYQVSDYSNISSLWV